MCAPKSDLPHSQNIVRAAVYAVALVSLTGCAHVRYGDFESTTFDKDISAKAHIEESDGRKIDIDLTSNANVELIKAGIGAGVEAAVKAIK